MPYVDYGAPGPRLYLCGYMPSPAYLKEASLTKISVIENPACIYRTPGPTLFSMPSNDILFSYSFFLLLSFPGDR